MNALDESWLPYLQTTWADVALVGVIGAAIVAYAWVKNRRKP